MMERHEHTNPWADKLQEVQLPDANDSWNAMQVLLDKEMPSGGQYDKRRWLLVILLLLLLIGVCNCPRQGRWSHRGPSGGPLPASDSSARLSETHGSTGPNPGVVSRENLTATPVVDSPGRLSETHISGESAPDADVPPVPGGTSGAPGSGKTTLGPAPPSGGNTPVGGGRPPRQKSDRITSPTGPVPVNHSGGSRPVPSGISPDNGAPSGTSPENSSSPGISPDNDTRSSVPAASLRPRGSSSVPKSARGIGGRDKETTGATGGIVKTNTVGKGAVRKGAGKKVIEGRDVVEEGTGGNDVVKKEDAGGKRIVKKSTGGNGIVKKGVSGNGTGKKIPEENEDEKKAGKNTAVRTGSGLRSGTPGTAGDAVTAGTPATTGASTAPGAPGTAGKQTAPGTPITGALTTAGNTVTAGMTTAGSAGKKGKDSTVAASPKPGGNTTAKKKPAAVPDNKQTSADKKSAEDTTAIEPDVYGWVAGIGFNQFFSVGQQQKSDYNSGGTTGGIGDYLPIPMVRYYFSRKLFVQMEAQFNAPQFTKKDLVAGQSAGVTLPSGYVQQNSVVIKKLFYFNLPISIHYSPIKNLYVGAGLQYSRLSNGVGLYEDKVLVPGGSDTVKAAKLYSFKGDSIYQKMRTNEFRLLLDLNYTYKRFIIGARYNQALSRFINVRLSDAQVTQARNSSLQLYIRYILWDGRKRKALSSK